MQTLFGEVDNRKEMGLKIVAKGNKILSKNQQLFNKLTKRIETLEQEIIKENEKLNKLLVVQGKEIRPLQLKAAQMRLKLAIALGTVAEKIKFTKKQSEDIGFTIVDLCDEAFLYFEPDKDQEAFYDKWADVPYKEVVAQQADEAKELFAEYMGDKFGMDIDLEDFDDSPDGMARFQAKMKEQFDEAQHHQQRQPRNRSKKQLARELEQKAVDELKAKNIRSIYIALVKILHPDTESDSALKAEKEEIMKKVTVAYDQKDLATLLKLEMEWVHKTSEHLEKLSDNKLKMYILALRQQVTELEAEKFNLSYNPRFADIQQYADYNEKHAMHVISHEKSELRKIFKNLQSLVSTFDRTTSKKHVLEFITSYIELKSEEDFWDDMDLNALPFY